jgi:hypothetical protein
MNRLVVPVIAAGLAASSLSFTAGAARADDDPTASPSSSPTSSPVPTGGGAFSGYSSTGIATPVKVEIFEPSIPIPTTPQAELDLGYAKVKGDSASTKGRASFMWPGDGVGEGLKTFFEQLGLPTKLVEDGYPAQVNSQYPSGSTKDTNTPFPGTSMTTSSADHRTRATVGFSGNCNAGDGAGDDSGDSDDDGGPGLPGVPGLPLLDNLDDILSVIGLGARHATTSRSFSPADDESGAGAGAGSDEGSDQGSDQTQDACQLPTALAALVDVNGYVADSQSVAGDDLVTTTSRTALGDVRLLGGIVTMSGVTSTVVAASDGTTGQSQGRADYGTMTIAGQTFGIGPEGYTAADQAGPIPGLPDDPAAALAALGISVRLPKPVYKADGDKASGTVEGLIVTIDLKTLSPVLKQLPLQQILGQIPFPPEAAQLKSLLSAIGNLSPKVVVHLGYTTAAVDTVQAIPLPETVPDNDPTDEAGDDSGGSAAGGASGGGAGLGGGAVPAGDTPSTTTDAGGGTLNDAALSSGLPPLFSIPGLLMVLGIGGALLAGNFVRRIGALALGGAGACSHGLESGLPDLRKVQS